MMISLRDYLARLDSLLNTSSGAPEVIAHCRHILQHYPKNAESYRLLGRALVASNRWSEAGEVLRRALSVFPDEGSLHLGLFDVYRAEKRLDEAIWHLERAYEQMPNNQPILENLRELYRRHRKIEQSKVQLTAGAAARQYIRNGLYSQAIDTLRQTLKGMPERLDLLLLLAKTYWASGKRVEAAETAIQILKKSSDCLEANWMLAEFWLAENRPSDAQRYIDRLQSLDPYLALELAQGSEVADDTYRLEELDYQKVAEREIVNRRPDWLEELPGDGHEAMPLPDDDWMKNVTAVPADQLLSVTQSRHAEAADDWLDEASKADEANIQDMATMVSARPPGRKRGLTGLLSAAALAGTSMEEPAAEPPAAETPAPVAQVASTGTNFFDDDELPGTTAVADELPDWLAEEPTSSPLTDTAASRVAGSDAEDPLAWLRSAGLEVDESAPRRLGSDEDVFDTADDQFALKDADHADPLGWLQGYDGGQDMLVENATVPAIIPDEDLPSPEDEDDPLAWLKASGVDIDPTVSRAAIPEADAAAFPIPAQASTSLDWLTDDEFLDEALNLETLVDDSEPASVPATAAMPERRDTMSDQRDPLDWMSSEDANDQADDAAAKTGDQPAAGSTSWFDQLPADESSPDASAAIPDWLDEEPGTVPTAASEVPNWMDQALPMEGSVTDDAAISDEFEWMSEEPSAEVPTAASEIPDWLSEAAPVDAAQITEPAVSAIGDEFEWISEEAAEVPTTAAEIPDWLSEVAPVDEPQITEPAVSAIGDEFEWISDEAAADVEAASPVQMPDWLSEVAPADEPQIAEPAVSAIGDEFEWISDEAAADVEAAAPVQMPDWLSEVAPVDEPQIAEPAVSAIGDEFEWISDEAAADVEAASPVQMPDWLSEVAPADEPQIAEPAVSAIGDEFEWISDEAAADVEAASPVQMPDWLSEVAPADEPQIAEPAVSAIGDEFEWISDEAAADVEAASPVQMPDWLSEVAPAGEPQIAEPAVSAIGDEFEWISDEAAADVEAASPVQMPDWLSEVAPADEPQIAEPAVSAIGDEFEWISDEAAAEVEAKAAAPDWLSEVIPADEPQTADVAGAISDEFEWMTEEPAVNAEAVAASLADEAEWMPQDAPPQETWSDASGFIEPVASDEPAVASEWIVEEAEPASAADDFSWETGESQPAAVVTTSTEEPEWLNVLQADEAAEEPVMADDSDWLAQIRSTSQMKAVTPTSSEVIDADVPDWVNDVHPEDAIEPVAAVDDWGQSSSNDVISRMTSDLPDWVTEGGDAPVPQAIDDDTPEWLRDMAPAASHEPEFQETQPTQTIAPEITSESARVDDEWVTEPLEAASASNAPDWLNAMVPGMDVDYSAPEDEQLEQDFAPGSENRLEPIVPLAAAGAVVAASAASRKSGDYDWLMNIVEEETQQVKTAKPESRRRWVFSRLPVWLRSVVSQPSNSGGTAEDDVDLPPWLR